MSIWLYSQPVFEQHTLNDKEIKSSAQKGQTYKYKDSYFLSFNYKSQILTSMIYGVDIDNQAVAVSKLSLLLKLLEWETAETTTLNKLFSELILHFYQIWKQISNVEIVW